MHRYLTESAFDIYTHKLYLVALSMMASQLLQFHPFLLIFFLVQQLFNEGARLFWIHNTGPLGCLPRANPQYKPSPEDLDSAGCRKSENEITQEFNRQLKALVFELKEKLPTAKFTYVDVYSAKYELIKNARDQGDFSFKLY